MKCPVCLVGIANAQEAAQAALCPNCGNELAKQLTHSQLLKARSAFRDKTLTYAPDTRVTTLDRAKPWFGLGLGIALFALFLAMCSSAFR